MIRPRAIAVAAALACAGCLSARAASGSKADVPVDQVPQVVVDAAGKAVAGIALSEAKMRAKKSGVVFKLAGTSQGCR